MAMSLKDALTKVGLKSSESSEKRSKSVPPKRGPGVERRDSADHREKNQSHNQRQHQHRVENSQTGERDRSGRDERYQRNERRNHDFQQNRDNQNRSERQEKGGAPRNDAGQQPQRISDCGSCHMTTPDVEFYMHDRKGLSARWLCAVCADKFMVSDEGRLTNQSDLSRKGLFKREYGRTKRFGFVKSLSELSSMMGGNSNNEGNYRNSNSHYRNGFKPEKN